jgi:histidinol-phosphate/aromatic aminotransferase/cobyric acid decarboxylase-like protein
MAKNLSEYVRISIGTKEENKKALKALKQVIAKGVGI